MNRRTLCVLLPTLLLPLAYASAIAGDTVDTRYTLFVGAPQPADKQEGSVLIVPGTVILPEPEIATYGTDVSALRAELMETYRLGSLEPVAADSVLLEKGREQRLLVPRGNLGMALTYLGTTDDAVTYRVRLEEAGQLLAEPLVSVKHGGRAIVALRDGSEAPYAFIVLCPRPSTCTGPMVEPKLTHQEYPEYPAAAKQAKVSGVVVLQCTIGTDGTVKEVKVLRSLPEGLTEAAVAAVKKWIYEPARNAQGEPMEVFSTVTVSFRLD
jgi:TonB family protein